jgi:uncharacterized membrane protein YbjE (DUF340 family)
MVDFKSGDVLMYYDRAMKKSWKVIALHRHAKWLEYMVCFVIGTPEHDADDLHSQMNIPVFCLYRENEGYRFRGGEWRLSK